jgi:hypothetical protein
MRPKCPPLVERRRVPMDDLISISEGLRHAIRAYLSPEEMSVASHSIDNAITTLRWNRRCAGDARKRNRILQMICKGA